MSWHEHLSLEVAATFNELSGGRHYERLQEAMWLGRLVDQERERLRHIDRWSSAVHRAYYRIMRRSWRKRARKTVVAIRCCPICARMYELTLFVRAEGKTNACSPPCRRLLAGKWPLYRIGREQSTLTGWAKRYGVDVETVRWRVKKGWSIQDALATPAAPPSERRWAKARKKAA
jgi:hypothetical protein